MFSNAAEYALRATAYLAANSDLGYVPARAIAEELRIPPTFLSKVLKQLVDAGVLTAYRGPTGGVKLVRPADAISLRDVIRATDGDAIFTECILGLPGCGNQKPCPIHNVWASHRSAMAEAFDRRTVASLAEAYLTGDFRLTP